MKPAQAIKTCLTKSFQFKGRAARSEYWWFFLATLMLELICFAVDLYVFEKDLMEPIISFWPASDIFVLITALPIAAVGARRLQDISFAGWPAVLATIFLLASTISEWGNPVDSPLSIFFVVWACFTLALWILALFPSSSALNKYGPNPHEVPS